MRPKRLRINLMLSLVLVVIICSPLNSPTTSRLIDQLKHFTHTKILLIDIIGHVFSFESRLYRNLAAGEYNGLMVLSIVTQKFKSILNSRFQLEFGRYLNLRSTYAGSEASDSFCDLVRRNGSHYQAISNDSALCERGIRERCSNYTNDEIKSACRKLDDGGDKHRLNDIAFNKQLVFSEHFNLFDFVTYLARDEKNASNHERQPLDFIVLDFKSILNATNESFAFWRPLMILEQNGFDRNIFMMHRATSDHDVFDDWKLQPRFWRCEKACWGIIAGIVLVLISLICIFSLSVGIAAR